MISWNRFYDPDTGRYLSADPIGLDGGMNLYAYVQNNPVNWVDPEGLWIANLIGAAVNLGFEGYRQYQSGDLNYGRLAVAAATGALGGYGSTLARAIGFGAASNVINTAYQQVTDPCSSLDSDQLVRSGLFGAGGGALGYLGGAIGRSIFRPTNTIGEVIGNMPTHHYGPAGAAFGAATGGSFANQ